MVIILEYWSYHAALATSQVPLHYAKLDQLTAAGIFFLSTFYLRAP